MQNIRLFVRSLAATLIFTSFTTSTSADSFSDLYQSLDVKRYALAPEDNIRNLKSWRNKEHTQSKTESLAALVEKCSSGLLCAIQSFEAERLLARLAMADQLIKSNINSKQDLASQPKLTLALYQHSLLEWTGDLNFPLAEARNFELAEISRISAEIKALGEPEKNLTLDIKVIEARLKVIEQAVTQNIPKLFTTRQYTPVKIAHNDDPARQNVPGFYTIGNQTFYYTMPEIGYDTAELDWLFLHEAIPGHHMQIDLDQGVAKTLFDSIVIYPDFIEAWAAYVEVLGENLGLYQTPAEKRKALQWDLVRSVRVIVDLGMHLDNWSDTEAKAFWKNNAPSVYHLAEREIKRMRRWPAQVISYEYGKMRLLAAREPFLATGGTLLEFHERILKTGQIPSSLIPLLFSTSN